MLRNNTLTFAPSSPSPDSDFSSFFDALKLDEITPLVSENPSGLASPSESPSPSEGELLEPQEPFLSLQDQIIKNFHLFFTPPKCLPARLDLEQGELEGDYSDDELFYFSKTPDEQRTNLSSDVVSGEQQFSPEQVLPLKEQNSPQPTKNASSSLAPTKPAELAASKSLWTRLGFIGAALSRDPATACAGLRATNASLRRKS